MDAVEFITEAQTRWLKNKSPLIIILTLTIMRKDEALLSLLYKADNEDLRVLADIITTDKKGGHRFNELLTMKDNYATYYPHNMRALVSDIVDELQCYGANTVMTLLRGGNGVCYHTILRDVAKKLKVSFNKNTSDENIERYILQKMFDDLVEKLSVEELYTLAEDMKVRLAAGLTKQAIIAILQAAIRRGGFQSYIFIVVAANAIARALLGRGLSLAANAMLMRLTSLFAGPIGIALNILWATIDIAGPAYRVTIPAVVQIAYIRNKVQHPEWNESLLE